MFFWPFHTLLSFAASFMFCWECITYSLQTPDLCARFCPPLTCQCEASAQSTQIWQPTETCLPGYTWLTGRCGHCPSKSRAFTCSLFSQTDPRVTRTPNLGNPWYSNFCIPFPLGKCMKKNTQVHCPVHLNPTAPAEPAKCGHRLRSARPH